MYAHGPMPGRVVTVEFDGPPADREAPVTEDLQARLRRVSGVDVTITRVRTATRFTDHARQVTDYRKGRVLLAGDATHVHSAFGNRGLSLGIGDAMNLGWKLAAVIGGRAPEGLLDTYTAERRPVGAWVLDWTRSQVAATRRCRTPPVRLARCSRRRLILRYDFAITSVSRSATWALRGKAGHGASRPLVNSASCSAGTAPRAHGVSPWRGAVVSAD